jgi:hypothetical protein
VAGAFREPREGGACGEPVLVALPRSEGPPTAPPHRSTYIMKSNAKTTQEPVGIVISGFPREPQTTVFAAYVWGPAPSSSDDNEPKAI